MKQTTSTMFLAALAIVTILPLSASATEVDRVLAAEHRSLNVKTAATPIVDDHTFLRRIYLDLIGRIPTGEEIREFEGWPRADRRERLIEKLLHHERFADRWTTFFADMLRLRSNATGGTTLIAYVHEAIANDMPYDELCRRLIAANGKADYTPEAGFVLADDADPLQLAAVTSQVFLGIRMSCAQCHDHPFDVWKREDFYGLAAFYGKTLRVESRLTKVIYTTENAQTSILWPPEDDAKEGEARKPMAPTFPIKFDSQETPEYVSRFLALRAREEQARRAREQANSVASVDDLLDLTADKAARQTKGGLTPNLDVAADAKSDIRKIDIKGSLYRQSDLRTQLGELVTDPRNRYFARAIVNRMWKELVGRGFVEPIDDFRSDNPISCPQTLDFIGEEFVASGYNIRHLVGMIVRSDVYARAAAPADADYLAREDLESVFLATPMRRMYAESLYDSIVTAGHLFELKHPAGVNNRTIYETVRVAVEDDSAGKPAADNVASLIQGDSPAMEEMKAGRPMSGGGYALESAIELDFTKVLKKKEEDLTVDQMKVMSAEELEAMRMVAQSKRTKPGMKYVTKEVKRVVDENPQFNSSYRIASPAPAGHFLRVFGQPGRQDLGDLRTDDPSMRQALMMLNGQVTHEASRVGALEPIYALLTGAKADLNQAIELAYLEVLTRKPTGDEVARAKQILGADPVEGMADLRWVLMNCNEFRFIP
ncbi:MAG: DUF1553 domain-containing protein [Planctomycetales bacterium]|nr:DUF1553 domain-containing protein [Planctomycetales bacterium]